MALADTVDAGPSRPGLRGGRTAHVARVILGELALLVAALAGEIGLLLAAQKRSLPIAVLLVVHLIICAMLFSLAARRARAGENTIPALLAGLLTLVAGPAGAGMALVGLMLGGRTRPRPELLEEWYDRIALTQKPDPTQQLCDRVAIGRSLDLAGPAPHSFADVVSRGTIAERQAALGLIARHFSPEYAAALHAALKSEEPVIRVQAAAVAARVREGLERRLVDLFRQAETSGLTPAHALQLASEINGAASSGLLDESTAMRAERIAKGLQGGVLTGQNARIIDLAALLSARRRQGGPAAVRRMMKAIETELIRAGDYARLRALRRLARVAVKGGLHIRPRRPHASPAQREAGR